MSEFLTLTFVSEIIGWLIAVYFPCPLSAVRLITVLLLLLFLVHTTGWLLGVVGLRECIWIRGICTWNRLFRIIMNHMCCVRNWKQGWRLKLACNELLRTILQSWSIWRNGYWPTCTCIYRFNVFVIQFWYMHKPVSVLLVPHPIAPVDLQFLIR